MNIKLIMKSIVVIAVLIYSLTVHAETLVHNTTAGDTLYLLSKRYGTSVNDIKMLNSLQSDDIYTDKPLIVRKSITGINHIEYTVKDGDTIGSIAENFGINITFIAAVNKDIDVNKIKANQRINVPADYIAYTVRPGDTLTSLSEGYSVSIESIKLFSNISNDLLLIGQQLCIPARMVQPMPNPEKIPNLSEPAYSFVTHNVGANETAWRIAVRHGIPVTELFTANDLNPYEALKFNTTLKIPVHHIPQAANPNEVENLDWWTHSQYLFPIGKTAVIVDEKTGEFFNVRRTSGMNHADCEPLSKNDTKIAKGIWGGFSSRIRSVIVETSGRRIAAAMSLEPHGIQYNDDNDMQGHVDIHFLNSTKHTDSKLNRNYQSRLK